MTIATPGPRPAGAPVSSRMRVFRADIAAAEGSHAQEVLAHASAQVSAAGAAVRLLYVRATYPPAEHPWVALFLAAGGDEVAHVSETARLPFAAVSEVGQPG